jgi:hypothetical protein
MPVAELGVGEVMVLDRDESSSLKGAILTAEVVSIEVAGGIVGLLEKLFYDAD